MVSAEFEAPKLIHAIGYEVGSTAETVPADETILTWARALLHMPPHRSGATVSAFEL